MEVAVGIAGHEGEGPVRRKEWRMVADSPRQRPLGGGTLYRSRGNGRVTHVSDVENCNEFPYHAVSSPTDSHSSLTPTLDEANGHVVQKEDRQVDFEQVLQLEQPDCTLEQKLHNIARQRENLQQAEVELRAHFLAQAEVMRLQSGFDEQAKQQSEIVASLQARLREKEQQTSLLEKQLEERERQLHNNQLEASEALSQAWANEGLLREQTNELATLRQEHENLVAEQKAASSQWEAERAECLVELQDLREQIREKDMKLQQVGEQHRATQDILSFKDEQLRDAQAWMARAQELDAYHVSANSSLQIELRDRVEQMNQLWLGYQRQLADMEMYHTQSIKRLQHQLAEVKEQNRFVQGGRSFERNIKRPSSNSSKEVTHIDETNEFASNSSKHIEITGSSVHSNGTVEGLLPVLHHDPPGKVEHATGLPVLPAPVVGLTTLVSPSGGLGGVHRFNLHHQSMTALQPSTLQGSPQGLGRMQPLAAPLTHQPCIPSSQQQQVSHVQQYHLQQPHLTTLQSHSHWQQPLLRPSVQQQPIAYPSTIQSQGNLHSKSVDFQEHHTRHYHEQAHGDVHRDRHDSKRTENALEYASQPQPHSPSVNHHSGLSGDVLSKDDPLHVSPGSIDTKNELSQQMPLQQHNQSLKDGQDCKQQVDTVHYNEAKDEDGLPENVEEAWQCYPKHTTPDQHRFSEDHGYRQVQDSLSSQTTSSLIVGQDGQQIPSNMEQMFDITMSPLHVSLSMQASSFEEPENDTSDTNSDMKSSGVGSSTQIVDGTNKAGDPLPLDESSLLACLVRAVPAEPSAKIRISSTLPNRLGKMLAPLHWHDYRKVYGRLDEFLSSHAELFVIEGDFIHLREGAHAAVSTMTAVAKAAAAVAAVTPVGPNMLPTVAVTPVAKSQMQRLNLFCSQKETLNGLSFQEAPNQLPLSSPQSLKPGTKHGQESALPKCKPLPNVRISTRSHAANGHSLVSGSNYKKLDDVIDRAAKECSKAPTLTSCSTGLMENGASDSYSSPRVQLTRENGFPRNKQQNRNQGSLARPKTQESCILGIVTKLAR